MAEQNKKKILLEQAMTWAGVNYAPGVNTMPEKGAKYAARKNFGKIVGDDGSDVDFDLLPLADTLKRFSEGNSSEQVLKSLSYHQSQAAQSISKPAEIVEENAKTDGDGKTGDGEGLPENFPMKHIFEAPNKHSETGFKTVAEIQKFSREQLIEIDGIGATTADKALAYGK